MEHTLSRLRRQSNAHSNLHGQTPLLQFLKKIESQLNQDIPFDRLNLYFRFNRGCQLSGRQVVNYLLNLEQGGRNELKKLKWHTRDKFVFVWTVTKFCQLVGVKDYRMCCQQWSELAGILSCQELFLKKKWTAMVRHTTCLVKWQPEEEKLLSKLMMQPDLSYQWTNLAIKLHEELSGKYVLRGCKDVRERWFNYLNPQLKKENWSEEEDDRLRELIYKIGGKWSYIAKLITGRTENQVKNRAHSLMKKRKVLSQDHESQSTVHIEQNNQISQNSQNNKIEDVRIDNSPQNVMNMSPLIPSLQLQSFVDEVIKGKDIWWDDSSLKADLDFLF